MNPPPPQDSSLDQDILYDLFNHEILGIGSLDDDDLFEDQDQGAPAVTEDGPIQNTYSTSTSALVDETTLHGGGESFNVQTLPDAHNVAPSMSHVSPPHVTTQKQPPPPPRAQASPTNRQNTAIAVSGTPEPSRVLAPTREDQGNVQTDSKPAAEPAWFPAQDVLLGFKRIQHYKPVGNLLLEEVVKELKIRPRCEISKGDLQKIKDKLNKSRFWVDSEKVNNNNINDWVKEGSKLHCFIIGTSRVGRKDVPVIVKCYEASDAYISKYNQRNGLGPRQKNNNLDGTTSTASSRRPPTKKRKTSSSRSGVPETKVSSAAAAAAAADVSASASQRQPTFEAVRDELHEEAREFANASNNALAKHSFVRFETDLHFLNSWWMSSTFSNLKGNIVFEHDEIHRMQLESHLIRLVKDRFKDMKDRVPDPGVSSQGPFPPEGPEGQDGNPDSYGGKPFPDKSNENGRGLDGDKSRGGPNGGRGAPSGGPPGNGHTSIFLSFGFGYRVGGLSEPLGHGGGGDGDESSVSSLSDSSVATSATASSTPSMLEDRLCQEDPTNPTAGELARKAMEKKEEKERHKEMLCHMREGYDGRRGGIAVGGAGACGMHSFDQLVAARKDAKRLGLLNDDELDNENENEDGEKDGGDDEEDEVALLDKMLKDRFLNRSTVKEDFLDDEEEDNEDEQSPDETCPVSAADNEEKEQERLAKRFAKRTRMQRLIEQYGREEEDEMMVEKDEKPSEKSSGFYLAANASAESPVGSIEEAQCTFDRLACLGNHWSIESLVSSGKFSISVGGPLRGSNTCSGVVDSPKECHMPNKHAAALHRAYKGPKEQLRVLPPNSKSAIDHFLLGVFLLRDFEEGDFGEGKGPSYAYTLSPSLDPIDLSHPGRHPEWGKVFFGSICERVGPRTFKMTTQQVAIKRLKKSIVYDYLQRGGQENPFKEVARMEELGDNEHVLKHIEFLEDDDFLYIVTPKATGRDRTLAEAIEWNDPEYMMEPRRIQKIFSKILKILQYLQEKGVCHRDISPSNFLFLTDDNLVAFDLAMSIKIPVNEATGQRCLIKPQGRHGTPAFMAPELYENLPFDGPAVDLWSAGCILYYLLSKKLPYQRPDALCIDYNVFLHCRDLSFGRLTNLEDPIVSDAMDLLEKLLAKDPAQRYTLEKATQSPFVQNEK